MGRERIIPVMEIINENEQQFGLPLSLVLHKFNHSLGWLTEQVTSTNNRIVEIERQRDIDLRIISELKGRIDELRRQIRDVQLIMRNTTERIEKIEQK